MAHKAFQPQPQPLTAQEVFWTGFLVLIVFPSVLLVLALGFGRLYLVNRKLKAEQKA